MAIRKKLGNYFDRIGTKYNLPELGISELFTGGATANTGRKELVTQPIVNYYKNYQNQRSMASEPETYNGPVVVQDENYWRQNWQSAGYRSVEEALADNGIPNTQATNSTPSFTSTSSGGGSTSSEFAALPGQDGYRRQPVTFEGQVYDVADPAQRQALFDARKRTYQGDYERSLSDLDRTYKTSFDQADKSYGDAIGSLDTDLGDLRDNFTDYETDYNRNIGDVNEGYDMGTVRRANFFARSSPLAYQSSQGTSQLYAQGKRDEALTDYSQARDSDISMMNRREAALAKERADLESSYNLFREDQKRSLEGARSNALNQFNQFLDSDATQFSGLDVAQNVPQRTYGRQAYDPLQFQQVDLSQYSPYTNFQQVSQSPQANFFKTFQPKVTRKQDPTDAYLGRTPEQKKQKDPLDMFLRG